jgi:hypothetical protein
MKQKWSRGHIGPFWDKTMFSDLPFIRQPVLQSEIDKWTELGYNNVKNFTGTLYDNKNPMPEWVTNLGNLFDLANQTYTIYKMETLEIMPTHVDHFNTYTRLFNAPYKDVKRILVMLEDWKPGHYLEIDGVGITSWIAGDWFIWDSDVPHAASNIGIEDRYTLQITGTKINAKKSMSDLHWFNIPNMPEKFETSRFPHTKVIKDQFVDDTPTYLYMLNGRITELEEIQHDDETINSLNETGIHIYLNEPLCSYHVDAEDLIYEGRVGSKHNMKFYSEFGEHINPFEMRADELDSILIYANNNRLTNIKVHTGDYTVEPYYPEYTSRIKLLTDDIFIKSQFNLRRIEKVHLTPNFNKKFICLNWRYTRHRFMTAAFLAEKSTYMTWYFRAGCTILNHGPWLNFFSKWAEDYPEHQTAIMKGVIHLNNNTPLNLDLNIQNPTIITHHYFGNFYPDNTVLNDIIQPGKINYDNLKKFYSDVFVDIVTESRFAQPTANYSEKALQPIFYKKPFIMVGPPKTLEYMKSMGFKTFSDFWDESYDDCYNHEDRLAMIFKIIQQIDEKSIDELRAMYNEMAYILEHNFDIANSMIPTVSEYAQ